MKSAGVSSGRTVVLESYEAENVRILKEAKVPSCGPHEILIRVRACALDDLDMEVRKGDYKSFVSLPLVPGYQLTGIVEELGSGVKRFSEGDEVAAILPLDGRQGGLSTFVTVNHINAVKKPKGISFESAAASLLDGLRAYHLLHYLAHVKQSQFVCLIGGNTALNRIIIQRVGTIKGTKLIVVANAEGDTSLYADCGSHVVRVIDPRCESLMSALMEETGGLGVDAILDLQYHTSTEDANDIESDHKLKENADNKPAKLKHMIEINSERISDRKRSYSMQQPGQSKRSENSFISKGIIIRCLAVHGKWCTNSRHLELRSHESLQLRMRAASLCFLFEHAWLLSPRYQGRYLHILEDIMSSLQQGTLKPMISKVAKVDEMRGIFRQFKAASRTGKIVIVTDEIKGKPLKKQTNL